MAFDFPNAPTVGQNFTPAGGPTYQWNGTVWVVTAQATFADAPNDANAYVRSALNWVVGYTKAAIDTLLGAKAAISYVDAADATKISTVTVSYATTNGSYNKPAGLKFLEVTIIGGGGTGTKAAITGAGQASASGGGGGAGMATKLYAAGSLAASEPYTVGAGGGQSAGVGAAGGTSTFKGMSATGGSGGGAIMAATGTFNSTTQGGNGGAGSGGDLNLLGQAGTPGLANIGAVGMARAGMGGAAAGGYAQQTAEFYYAGSASTVAGNFPGGGSSGGGNGPSIASSPNTLAGASGVIIFKEYY